MRDKKVILLKACRDLLNKQNESPYVLNILEELIVYDDAECDGYCLLEDIEEELDMVRRLEKANEYFNGL